MQLTEQYTMVLCSYALLRYYLKRTISIRTNLPVSEIDVLNAAADRIALMRRNMGASGVLDLIQQCLHKLMDRFDGVSEPGMTLETVDLGDAVRWYEQDAPKSLVARKKADKAAAKAQAAEIARAAAEAEVNRKKEQKLKPVKKKQEVSWD